ncbi:MAG: hypothetical protein AAF656_01610 [Planctomycetota bacterium]
MKNPFHTPDHVDERILKTAVPVVGGIAVLTLGAGMLQACCSVSARRFTKFGFVPAGAAALTSAVAIWAYLNPNVIPVKSDDLPEPVRSRVAG